MLIIEVFILYLDDNTVCLHIWAKPVKVVHKSSWQRVVLRFTPGVPKGNEKIAPKFKKRAYLKNKIYLVFSIYGARLVSERPLAGA